MLENLSSGICEQQRHRPALISSFVICLLENIRGATIQYGKTCIAIWKTHIAIHIAIHLVSLVLSITAPSSVLLYNSRVMKLASLTHCQISSYSLCPSVAFQREMIEILLFPFRYFTTFIYDYHPPSFFKPKVAVACWSNLQGNRWYLKCRNNLKGDRKCVKYS